VDVSDRSDRSTNLVVARLFEEIARSLEVSGQPGHRPRAYRRAARAVAAHPEPVELLAAAGRLREVPGVGQALEALIAEFLDTGGMRTHARLAAEHPPGLAPLLQARGFGPASIQSLFAAVGATDLDELERAGADGRLASAIGSKRARELLDQLPALRNPVRALRLKSAAGLAHELTELMTSASQPPRRIELAGPSRRMCEMVEGGLDLVALPGPLGAGGLLDLLASLPSVAEVTDRNPSFGLARLYEGVVVRLHVAEPDQWGAALLWHTGSEPHVRRLDALAAERGWRLTPAGLCEAHAGGRTIAGQREEDIYRALGLPWIAPELREDSGEIEAALAGELPRLLEAADLRGDMHCHTEWTDGSASLEDMAIAARDRGYAYMALTDHSRSLTITNGLSLERLEEARRAVARVNQRLAPFTVLLGTEMDILEDGRLDYPDDVLSTLDYVSASVHSRFKQPEAVMTQRIVRAVSHPLVHTLNHPHGRLLGIRPAYAVDMQRVIEAAASAGCALEVSADPARMDLDGAWARRARAAGAHFTVSSDAHSTLDYDNIWLGIGSARRAWLGPTDVLNARSLEDLRAKLRARGR
jgi:DNA polymerase (family X)